MKKLVIISLLVFSFGLKAEENKETDNENLDEAFLLFLSEWGQIQSERKNMLVLDSMLEREGANMKKDKTDHRADKNMACSKGKNSGQGKESGEIRKHGEYGAHKECSEANDDK